MALRLKFRSISISRLYRSLSTAATAATTTTTSPSSIPNPNPNSKSSFSAKDKSRAALNLLLTEKSPERILQICRLANLTPAVNLDRVAFSTAVTKLRELNYTEIREFLEESVNRSDIKTERSAAPFLVLFGQAGLSKDAVKVFEKMPQMGLDRTVRSLNALITACFYDKNYEEMKRVYAEFPGIYGIIPNLGTYNMMIRGLCASGDSSAAFSILSDMDNRGVEPNSNTFEPIIAGIYKEEKFEDVQKVLKAMKEHNIAPGIKAYNIRIQSLCKLKRSKEAMALFEELEEGGIKPDSATFTNLIHGFGREGDLEEAKRLFDRMVAAGIDPNWQAYSTLVFTLCQGKDFQAAAVFCKDWIARDCAPTFATLKSLVEGLAGISMADEAKVIIGILKEKFPANSDRWTELEELLA